MTYNLLIVDDEPEILDFLQEICEHISEYKLDICTADSGLQALKVLERTRIDVLLTDIRMPGISGIALMQQVRQNWPECKIIFLTGYEDFDNVYAAIQKGGVRYLLKTEPDSKIQGAVVDSIGEMEANRQQKDRVKSIEKKINDMLPSLQRECIADMIDGLDSVSATREKFSRFTIPLRPDLPFILFVGYFDGMGPTESTVQKYRCYTALREMLEETLAPRTNGIGILHDRSYVVWLLQPNDMPDGKQSAVYSQAILFVLGGLEYVQKLFRQSMNCTVSFAVAEQAVPVFRIPDEYACLRKSLLRRYGTGTEMLLQENALKLEPVQAGQKKIAESEMPLNMSGKMRLLKESLEQGCSEEYFALLGEMGNLLKSSAIKRNKKLEIYFQITTVLLGYINDNNLSDEIVSQVGSNPLLLSAEQTDWAAVSERLFSVSRVLFETASSLERKRAAGVTERLRRYIVEHPSEDLSLAALAEKAHFNASYLSRLFKQVCGCNLSDFVLSTRMALAKKYLEESNLKVNEIAQAVGYSSPHSFARIFRQQFNLSPQEYRTKKLNL